MFYKNEISAIRRTIGTIVYSLLFVNSALGSFVRLKYVYPVISVIDDSLPANTKMSRIDKFVDGQSAISRILCGEYLSNNQRMEN